MSASNGTVIYKDEDYAGGPRRLVAVAIDLFVCLALLSTPISIATALWVAPEHQVKLDDAAKQRRLVYEDIGPPRFYATMVVSFLLPFAYQIAFRRLRGGTIGYRIARIRLIAHDGRPPTWRQLSIRTLASLLAFFTLGMVFLPTFRWKKRQAFHDRLAGTWMVNTRAQPVGPGQLIYKTKLMGTYPLTFADVEPLSETQADAPDSSVAEPADALGDPAS